MPLSAETFAVNLYVALASPLVGSAVAAGAARFASGDSWSFQRSSCPTCGRRLGVAELVPIISWLALRGKCRGCAGAIAVAYPLTELAAVAVAIWAWLATPPHVFAVSCVLGWLLLALSVIDLRTRRLPDPLNLVLALAGLGVAAWLDSARMLEHLAGMVIGYGAFVAIEIAYRALRGRDGLGRGDAKLIGAIGAWIGLRGLPGCIFVAAIAGIFAAVIGSWLRRQPLAGETALSFGPFLALGGWLTWLHGPLVF